MYRVKCVETWVDNRETIEAEGHNCLQLLLSLWVITIQSMIRLDVLPGFTLEFFELYTGCLDKNRGK